MKLHSVTDLITNSSTTIYTYVSDNGVKIAEGIINRILEAAGSNKKCEDLFILEIKYDTSRLRDYIECELEDEELDENGHIIDYNKTTSNMAKLLKEFGLLEKWDTAEYGEKEGIFSEFAKKLQKAGRYNNFVDDFQESRETTLSSDLVIRDKENNVVSDRLRHIYGHEAKYDG